jgi:hypothetical protein
VNIICSPFDARGERTSARMARSKERKVAEMAASWGDFLYGTEMKKDHDARDNLKKCPSARLEGRTEK